jgi:hypothetical protein
LATGWIFLVEYGSDSKQQSGGPAVLKDIAALPGAGESREKLTGVFFSF